MVTAMVQANNKYAKWPSLEAQTIFVITPPRQRATIFFAVHDLLDATITQQ